MKMHGLGNDFVVLDGRVAGCRGNPGPGGGAWADRHTGIGFDQLALIARRGTGRMCI